jgi:hypothetical protein
MLLIEHNSVNQWVSLTIGINVSVCELFKLAVS